MDFATAIGSVTAAIGLVKELKDIDNQFDKAELKLKIAELTTTLADTKMAIAEIADEIKRKDDEILALKNSIKRREDTVEAKGYRYFKSVEGSPKGRALCPVCYDDGSFVLTVELMTPGHPTACPKCKANFGYLPSYADEN